MTTKKKPSERHDTKELLEARKERSRIALETAEAIALVQPQQDEQAEARKDELAAQLAAVYGYDAPVKEAKTVTKTATKKATKKTAPKSEEE